MIATEFRKLGKKSQERFLDDLDERDQELLEEMLDAQEYQSRPTDWVEEFIGGRLWEKQKEILDAFVSEDRIAVRSCHGAGKTYIAARAALWFLNNFENSIVITTAPTFRQVKKILWKEIRVAHSRSNKTLKGKPLTAELKIDDDWFAFGFSTDDPDAFQGIHADHVLVIFDEASGIAPDIWTSSEGVLSNEHAVRLVIGNPTDPASIFASEFRDSHVKHISISAFDTPNFTEFGITEKDIKGGTWRKKINKPLPYPGLISPSWVAERYRKWRPESPMYQARVMGIFPEQGTDTLIPLAWIDRAVSNYNEDMDRDTKCKFGVDVAYSGPDSNVVAKSTKDLIKILDTWTGQDTQQTAGRVIRLARDHSPKKINVDCIGYGAGVADRIIEDFPNLGVRINVAEISSDQEQYKNLRAELYWNLRERFEENSIALHPDDEDFHAQLSSLKYKITGSGQIQIESKEDMKKRIGGSPDESDAAMLSLADQSMELDFNTGNLDLGTSQSKWRR